MGMKSWGTKILVSVVKFKRNFNRSTELLHEAKVRKKCRIFSQADGRSHKAVVEINPRKNAAL